MTLYKTDKALWCKLFPTTLQEGPLGWFTKLPTSSVGSFKDLTTKFITQYATSRPHHTSSLSLLNVKQEKGESLRAFMDRFSKVCMSIRNLMPKIAMHHLVGAIQPGKFTENLIKRPVRDMDELRTRATKFMQIEEHVDYHKAYQAETTSKESKKEKGRGNRLEPKRVDRFKENCDPRFNSYTPLTVRRGRILDEALQAELIPTLKSSQTPQNTNTSKHC